MATLAIKGHATRGKEVIEILEMFGGKNIVGHYGNNPNAVYYISHKNMIMLDCVPNVYKCVVFTLEEFLEKFPYKVGDKVTLDKWPCTITGMSWEYDDIIYYVQGIDFSKGVYSKDKDLQPYKEETMKEKIESFEILESHCSDEVKIEFDPSKFEIVKRYNGYYVVKKQPQYPKTYEECAKELGYNQVMPIDHILGYKGTLLSFFQKLLICRDAYWKIVRDWKFDFDKESYYLCNKYGEIQKFKGTVDCNVILTFPTEEMQDAFYENFKELIEQCKQLL